MFGVALEGGGAKGAFHIGAVKALLDHGYKIDGAVGTSIGAFNAALISQGDFEAAYTFWKNVQPSTLFDIDNTHMEKLVHSQYDIDTIKYFGVKTKEIIENKGIPVDRLRAAVDNLVSEEKLRASDKDYGLVTVSITDLKPIELYKEQIPERKLGDFILASANFPGFKSERIDEKRYFDGGIYNNCPVNLLVDKGYDEVYAIRTGVRNKMRNVSETQARIVNVTPSEDLGSVLIFDQELIHRNITLGYYDTLRHIKGLKGRKYYIEPEEEMLFRDLLCCIPEEAILAVGKCLKLPMQMDSTRMLFERILPSVASLLKLSVTASYQDIVIGFLEVIAKRQGVKKFHVYTWKEFTKEIKTSLPASMRLEADMAEGHLTKIKKKAIGRSANERIYEIADILLEYLAEDLVVL